MAKAFVGSRAPMALEIEIPASAVLPDMTAVSAVTLHLQCGAAAQKAREWAMVIVEPREANKLVARRLYAADGSDLHCAGTWKMYAELTVAGGAVRTDVGTLEVVGRFG